MLRLLREMEHHGPLPRDAEDMHPNNIVEHPPSGGVRSRLPFVSGTRCILPLQPVADAVLQGGIHQSTHRHHHAPRHKTRRFLAGERRGQTWRVLQKPAAAFCLSRACVGFQKLVRRQLGGVACGGGQEEPAGLVDKGLTGRHA